MGFVRQVQYFRCLRDSFRDLTKCVAGAIFSLLPRYCPWRHAAVACDPIPSFSVAGTIVSRDPTYFLVAYDPFLLCNPCHGFCVAGAIYFAASESVALRLKWPLVTSSVWQVRYFSLPPRRSPTLLVGRVTLKPFPHPSPHPKTPVPLSSTLKGGFTYKGICLSTMLFCHFETLPPPKSPP